MAGSLREALTEAYDTVESEPGADRPSMAPISDDLPATEPVQRTESTELPSDNEPVVKETPKPQAKPAPKKLGAESYTPEVTAPEDTSVPKTAIKAPQSWKPALREKFAALPPDVQAEVMRREGDVNRALSESANSRKFHQDFSQVIRPFEALIAGSGVHPLQAVRNLMTTAATLQTGTQAQRASTVANIIKAYGVDIATLDAVLSNQKVPQKSQQADLSQQIERAVSQRLEPFTRQQQEAERKLNETAQATVEEMGTKPEFEYFEDLREEMADLLDLAAQRGRVLSMEDAYKKAAALHPEISKLVAKKEAAAKLQQNKGNINRARRAAASQPNGSPAAPGSARSTPKGLRNSLATAWDDLSSGA